MANSLSFQSLDSSRSMLGASGGERDVGREEGGGRREGGGKRGIQLDGRHDNKAHLKSICCNKDSSSSP